MRPGLKVVLLEKTSKLLSKVKVSGGGRCNVTHALFDIGEMSRRYPRGQNFVKRSFHNFFTTDTVEWFKARGVKLRAENDGRMFPVTDSSQTIIDCLMNEANMYGVEIRMNAEVRQVKVENAKFIVSVGSQPAAGSHKPEVISHKPTINSHQLTADFICIACGGYPKASMFQWLLELGHTVAEPVPSLFTFNLPKHPITTLMGVSVEKARVKIGGSKLVDEGPVLITHWGLSGPAVLRLSAWGARELQTREYRFRAQVNWLPEFNEQTLKSRLQEFRSSASSKKIAGLNFGGLPNRLWLFLLQESGIGEEMRFADLPARQENALIKNLVDYTVEVSGKTTYKEEFVTAGGINLAEVDAHTMMSKKHPNLFFAGEILDVDGITGGFNFQHAWTSGWIAAKSVGERVEGVGN
jgi:predicted Rossmann fold flavoprotein